MSPLSTEVKTKAVLIKAALAHKATGFEYEPEHCHRVLRSLGKKGLLSKQK